MSTHSHNSNESMPDESMEVIRHEDLEDSPPPADVEVIGSVEDVKNANTEIKEKVIDLTADSTDEEIKSESAAGDISLGAGDKSVEDVSLPAPAVIPAPVETPAPVEAPAVVEEAPKITPAPADDPEIEILPPAPKKVSDDPPLEILGAPRVQPVLEPPKPVVEPSKPVVEPPKPQVVATRPTVTPARPSATLEEEDDEEDDDDIDETLTERLVGLTEMFPQFIRNGSVRLAKGSMALSQASFSFAKAATWVIFSTATILFMPVMIETERLQLQDQQKAMKNQILLGPGMAQSGGPSLGPPPI